jgi:hypothetical protein
MDAIRVSFAVGLQWMLNNPVYVKGTASAVP